MCHDSFIPLLHRNRAIADYLRSNGYEEAYSTFKKEVELDMVRRDGCTNLKTNLMTNVDIYFYKKECVSYSLSLFSIHRMKR